MKYLRSISIKAIICCLLLSIVSCSEIFPSENEMMIVDKVEQIKNGRWKYRVVPINNKSSHYFLSDTQYQIGDTLSINDR
jgi:hypothetical protein